MQLVTFFHDETGRIEYGWLPAKHWNMKKLFNWKAHITTEFGICLYTLC